MTSPVKPWEMAGVNSRMANPNMDSGVLSSSAPSAGHMAPGMSRVVATVPALPPRPYAAQRPGMSAMSSSYGMPYGGGFSSSFGYGGYGGMGLGGYGSYGGYGSGYGGGYGGYGGYNQYGNGMFGNVESRFIQMAEESSRPAFQSIESLVGAVGSVAMMLDNTFMAITSSFRAILGVADNFGRLRTLFTQFWSAFAVFRGINWLLKKLLVLMGIRTEEEFKAWAEATAATGSASNGSQGGVQTPSGSSWPVLLFLGIITAAPYIILKMLGSINSTIQGNTSDPTTWQNPMRALAQYDFQASSTQELSFRANQVVTIAPEAVQGNLWNSGWLMATVDMKTTGLIPANYVKLFRNNQPALPQAPPTSSILRPESLPMANDGVLRPESLPTTNDTVNTLTARQEIMNKDNSNTRESEPLISGECVVPDSVTSLRNSIQNAQPEIVNFNECFENAKSS